MKKNGFTLIELLAVIVIIAIMTIVGIASFSFTKNEETNQKSTKNNVENAINVYYQNLYKSNKLKYLKYSEDDNNIMEFCISFENLEKGGYLNKENIPKYDYILVKKVNEEIEYTYTNDQNDCKKNKINVASIKNDENTSEGKVEENEEVNKYLFSQSITQTDIDSYKVESNFKIKVLYEIDTVSYVPIYTVMVLDRSGSMSGTPITNAVNAIKTLTTNFNSINSNYALDDENRPVYCTSVVEFQNSASLETPFTDEIISPGTDAPGGTVYGAGLSVAENILNDKKTNSSSELCKKYATNSNALGFVIFLSDGSPFDSFGSSGYGSYSNPKVYSERMKQNGITIFTISYVSTNNDNLKCIASRSYADDEEKEENDYITCNTLSDSTYLVGYDTIPSSSQKKVFYFEASEKNLNSVFEKFSTVASKMSQSSEYETAKIIFTLNDNFFEKKNNKEGESKYIITSTVDLTTEETITDGFVTGASDFDIRLTNTSISDNTEIPLFKSITINLIDNEKIVSDKTITIPEANLPKVNAYKYIDNLIN